jgi:hypothetical protein
LVGSGPSSRVCGTVNTKTKKPAAIIVTEDFGKNIAMFSAGEASRPDYLPAVLRPVVKDFTLCGFDETNTNYRSGGVVNDVPGKWNPADRFPDLYGGIFLQSSGAIVQGVTAFYIPGTAFSFSRTGAVNAGAFGPWDVEKTIIRDCSVQRAYRGFNIQVIDASVSGLQGYAVRDYGVKFSAGSTHIDGSVHFWGVNPGPAVWFPETAGACWGGPFYVENSPIGMLIESSGHMLHTIYSKHCWDTNIKITRERNTLGPIDLEVANGATGISVFCQFNKLLGGTITLGDGRSVGIAVQAGGNSGNGLVVRDMWIRGHGAGTGFRTADTLHNTTIKAHFQSLKVGMDLVANRIGNANDIEITTSHVEVPILMPPNWNRDINRIVVNGVRM